MAKVSPSWVKNADKIASSSCDLSFAISQASKEIKLTKAHELIKTSLKTKIYILLYENKNKRLVNKEYLSDIVYRDIKEII